MPLHTFLISLACALLAPLSANAKVRFETKLSLLPRYYFEEIGKGTNRADTPIVFEPTLTWKVNKSLRFKLSPYLYSDPVSVSPIENFFLDVNEANAEYRFGDSSVAIGLNQIAWGVTDVFNPVDMVSARRYFDPLNNEKRGAPSLVVKHEVGDLRFEGIYIPVQLPSVLPGRNSRWLPRDVTYNRQTNMGKIVLPEALQFDYRSPNEIDGSLHHNFGGRIELHTSGIDLSTVVFQGAPTVPSIFPIVTGDVDFEDDGSPVLQADPQVGLRPDYYLRRTVGATAVVTLESTILRFAVTDSVRVSGLNSVPGWSQSSVFGMEHNIAVGQATLTALAQVTYARHEIRADNLVTSVDRIFDQSALLGFRLATSDEWTFTAAALYEHVYKGTFVQARADKKLADGVSGSIQGELINAPGGTPLGSYSRNDRVGLGLTLFF